VKFGPTRALPLLLRYRGTATTLDIACPGPLLEERLLRIRRLKLAIPHFFGNILGPSRVWISDCKAERS